MAKQVLLQLDYLQLNRKRQHWNIYFILSTADPKDASKMMITTLPGGESAPSIELRRSSNNEIHFQPEGQDGGDGLFVFQHDLPADYHIQARLWVMHARRALPQVSTVLKSISQFITDADSIVSTNGVAAGTPWLVAEKVANKGIGGVAAAINQLPNHRNLGFISLDEHFGHAFDQGSQLDLHNTLSTGYGEVGWTWEMMDTST